MTIRACSRPSRSQQLARWGVGAGLAFAGTSHVTFGRQGFQAQVPPWVPVDTDVVVVLSGAAEIALGAGLLALAQQRRRMAGLTAAFLVGVFPGNISQYRNRLDGLGLNTDRKRFLRLFFPPLMCAVALQPAPALQASSLSLNTQRHGDRSLWRPCRSVDP